MSRYGILLGKKGKSENNAPLKKTTKSEPPVGIVSISDQGREREIILIVINGDFSLTFHGILDNFTVGANSAQPNETFNLVVEIREFCRMNYFLNKTIEFITEEDKVNIDNFKCILSLGGRIQDAPQ